MTSYPSAFHWEPEISASLVDHSQAYQRQSSQTFWPWVNLSSKESLRMPD